MTEPLSTPPGQFGIPRIIWQTYITRDLPPQAVACQKSWIEFNPGWEYRFVDDAGMDDFVEEHAPGELYRLYHQLPLGVMKADVWRYLATYVHGGLYADIDTICRESIDNWLPAGADFVICPENRTHLCQWTFLSIPRHPCLWHVLELIADRAKHGIDTGTDGFVHFHTGPGVWTDAILQATGCPETNMIRLSRSGNLPCLRSMNIRILGWKYFREWKVKHLYGSIAWEDGYESWTKARDAVSKAGG